MKEISARHRDFRTTCKTKNKAASAFSVFSVKDNTRRDKSLSGFSIWFAYLAKGEIYKLDIRLRLAICLAGREGIYIISHWSEATIYRTSKASISRSSFVNIFHESEYIAKQKKRGHFG